MSDYLKRRATSIGIDDAGLVRSQEEIQMLQQQQQQMAAMQQAVGPGVNAVGKIADSAMKAEPSPEEQPPPEG